MLGKKSKFFNAQSLYGMDATGARVESDPPHQ